MKFITTLLTVIFSVAVNAEDLKAGDIWSYKARVGETNSTITILKIENYKDLGQVIHIRINNIKILNQLNQEQITSIGHLPFNKTSLTKSLLNLISSNNEVPHFADGYASWKKAYMEGNAGVFNMPVKAALDSMLSPRAQWVEQEQEQEQEY